MAANDNTKAAAYHEYHKIFLTTYMLTNFSCLNGTSKDGS